MRSDVVSLLIVIVVTAVMAYMAADAFQDARAALLAETVEAADTSLGLVVEARGRGFAWLAAIAAWFIYVYATSFTLLKENQFLLSYFLGGTLREQFISGTAYESNIYARYVPNPEIPDGGEWVYDGDRSILGNIIILLWPIYRRQIFPTTQLKMVVHATTVYTRQHDDSPSVPARVDVTILARLRPNLRQFVQAITGLGEYDDLSHTCDIRDNLWDETRSRPGEHTYKGPVLAGIILDNVVETVLQSVRTIASEHYTWDQVKDPNDPAQPHPTILDIRSAISDFRQRILNDLAAKEASTFVQAGMLQHVTAEEGPSLLSFDVRVEDVQLEDPLAVAALSRPMIEKLEAEAQKRKGKGEGDRLKEKAERAGFTGESQKEIFRGEVVQGVEKVEVISAGDGVIDTIKNLFGNKGKKP